LSPDLSDCGPECLKALREIERFLDGESEPGVRAYVVAHLAGCSPCSERAAFRRHVKELIGAKCREEEVPAELQVRISALVRDIGEA
jgi:mycothiol system anti-sigma-R factor